MDKQSQQKWDHWARTHDNLFESVERSPDPQAAEIIYDDLAAKLDLQPGQKLLDVGCGSGVVCSELGTRYRLDVTGVDFALAQVELAVKHFPQNNFAQAPAEQIPFVEDTFDKVLSYGVFHYVDDWQGAIRGFIRCTRSGGRVLIGDLPSKAHKWRMYLDYFKRIGIIIKNLRSKVGYAANTSHWHWLNLKEMKRFVESLGHEVEILRQPPEHRQYGNPTHSYRFDLLIKVNK